MGGQVAQSFPHLGSFAVILVALAVGAASTSLLTLKRLGEEILMGEWGGWGRCSQLGLLSLAKASTSGVLGLAALLPVAGSLGEQEVSPPGLLCCHGNANMCYLTMLVPFLCTKESWVQREWF